jgi:hypothetical protein
MGQTPNKVITVRSMAVDSLSPDPFPSWSTRLLSTVICFARIGVELTELIRFATATSKPKRGSFFALSLDFGAEIESTQDEIKAKEEALLAPPVRSETVRKQQLSVAEHVVNDDEQWKKFKEQLQSGGSKTGMQLRHNLDGLLQSRAQELEASGAVPASKVDDRRRASLTDFASSLIRGDGRPTNRRASAFTTTVPVIREGMIPTNTRKKPPHRGSSSERVSSDGSSLYMATKRIADYLVDGD